jgi:hypothetical protein
MSWISRRAMSWLKRNFSLRKRTLSPGSTSSTARSILFNGP